MATSVMLNRRSPDAITDLHTIRELGQQVTDKLDTECPEAEWISSFAVLGPYDYVDLFEAPDNEAAAKVAVIVRSFDHAMTEIWPATPWDRFVDVVRSTSD